MKILISESQVKSILNELELDLEKGRNYDDIRKKKREFYNKIENQSYYNPDEATFTTSGNLYTIHNLEGKPIGRFNMVLLRGRRDEYILEAHFSVPSTLKQDWRNWYRCIGQLPLCHIDWIKKNQIEPFMIPIYGKHPNKYTSKPLIDYMMSYFGDDYKWVYFKNGISLVKK